ncbi:MAG: phenylalanine--tRNA ligase subunit beta, partial [Candidatus Micrarchaeota archaeon]|nr:phenylalanine--tRNA ligase subunit beta [Candidatus Micrarchaeota archaeon]
MAVVEYSTNYISKETGLKANEIKDILSRIGMPTEIVEENAVIEVTPNRPDLLTIEGVVRALNGYARGKVYEYKLGKGIFELKNEGSSSRPFVVAALVKEVDDVECLYDEIMQAQEKIHDTLGRKRKKAAVGIHDADKIEFPLRFREVKEGSFVPLGMDKEMKIGEMLKTHEKGKAYAHLLEHGKYPVVEDKIGIVSVPPIINSERTKVTEKTRNFLIEITGTNPETLEYILNIFVCALADRGGKVYGISINGKIYPDLECREIEISRDAVEKISGIEMEMKDITECLKRMNVEVRRGIARIPPYRRDITNEVDIIEDVLIGYGYDIIKEDPSSFYHIGKENRNVEKEIFESMGFLEVKNFLLCDKKEYEKIMPSGKGILEIENPLTEELNSIKNTTLIELIKTVEKNKMKTLPLKFFEIDRVYDGKEIRETGFVLADKSIKVEDGISVLKRIVEERGWKLKFDSKIQFKDLYVDGWSIAFSGDVKGELGVIKPEILN